jgi:hypothetical protein
MEIYAIRVEQEEELIEHIIDKEIQYEVYENGIMDIRKDCLKKIKGYDDKISHILNGYRQCEICRRFVPRLVKDYRRYISTVKLDCVDCYKAMRRYEY